MCGRYSLAVTNPADARAAYPALEALEIRPRYNIAPTDEVLAVTLDREQRPRGDALRWGLVPFFSAHPRDGARRINARIETVAERPAFRHAFRTMRCLIPADGFYEWQRRGDGARQAFHITPAERRLFAFAGLWSVWHGPDGAVLRTCTILTTAANAAIAPLHDRMPVILAREDEEAWLDLATPATELVALARGLSAEETAIRPVGSAVGDVRYDGPACLEDPAERQPTLF